MCLVLRNNTFAVLFDALLRSLCCSPACLPPYRVLLLPCFLPMRWSTTQTLEQDASTDFGEDGALWPLKDKCVSTKTGGYEYRVCPFKDAHQEEGRSKVRVSRVFFATCPALKMTMRGVRVWCMRAGASTLCSFRMPVSSPVSDDVVGDGWAGVFCSLPWWSGH